MLGLRPRTDLGFLPPVVNLSARSTRGVTRVDKSGTGGPRRRTWRSNVGPRVDSRVARRGRAAASSRAAIIPSAHLLVATERGPTSKVEGGSSTCSNRPGDGCASLSDPWRVRMVEFRVVSRKFVIVSSKGTYGKTVHATAMVPNAKRSLHRQQSWAW